MIDIDKAFNNRWRIKGFDELEVRQLSGEDVARLCRDFFEAGILLSKEPEVTVKGKTPLELRAEKFCQSLNTAEYTQRYGMQLLKDFYDYWTEPNKSHTKMRFELQQTFDIDRRLARWARNNFNRYDRQQQRLEKLADILTT